MKKYLLATLGLFTFLFIIAYSHSMIGSYFSGADASSNYIFSYGYVSLLLGCILAMSWGNISSFEEYQKSISEKKTFGLKLGGVFASCSALLMITASFI